MSGGLVISGARLAIDGQAILGGIDLVVAAGTVHGLIGPNGAGKSTLMRASLGLIALDAGTVTFADADFLALPRRHRARISAFVDQSTATDLRLSARDTVLLGRIPFQSLWQSEPSPTDQAAADAALAAVGMAGLTGRLFDTLSGGEQQRLQIARALAQEPRLLLLDEPTNHLDIHAQLAVLDLLRAKAAEGLTVLLALHDLNLAASFCDTISVIDHGVCVASGTPDAVLTRDLLASVYGVSATVLTHPQSGRPLIAYDSGAAPAQ